MAKSYCEMTIRGPQELIKGFVIGYVEGRGIQDEAILEGECRIEQDNPLGLIMHFFADHHTVPFIVESELCKSLSDAFRKHESALQARIESVRELAGARFDFQYRTFSRDMGKSLLELFSNPPEGVRISDYDPKEKITPEGKGVEAYTPLHDYDLKAKGAASGDVKEVYELYCRAARFEVVETGDLKLVYGKELV
jgi:hypothetical protein